MTFRYLKILRSPTTALLEILNNNIIGTPGQGMLYQHLNVSSKINQIADPYFVSLVRADQIAGTCCFCSRETLNHGQKIRSFYVRYFSFRDLFRRKTGREKIKSRNSGLRKEIELLLSGEGLGLNPSEKFFHYAYVDPANERSAILCEEFGFEPVRQYTTVIFSRLNPKGNKDKISTGSSDESVQELLKTFYTGFTTLSFENISSKNYYFIKNEKDQIVAGVHVNPDKWRIHSLPGLMSILLLRIFTRIPILNKLLNEEFKFITFEGIYLVPGNEKHLEKLFESLLAKYNVNSAISILDPGSKLYPTLKSLRLGLMSNLNKEVRGNVICKFVNFNQDEKNTFKSNPVYISGIDAT